MALKDIIVIDNVFDNPDEVVSLATSLEYYDKDNHPVLKNLDEDKKISWPGLRSESLHFLNNNLFNQYNKIIINKMIQYSYGKKDNIVKIKYDFMGQLFFHYTPSKYSKDNWEISDDLTKDNWFHKDENMYYAGVIYLHKNPPKNTGTILKKDNKEIVIDNMYNRMVIYDANILHAPQDSFGENVYDSRLTLTIFFKKLLINII